MSTVQIKGLTELENSFNSFQKSVASSIASTMVDIEKALQKDITGIYTFTSIDFTKAITARTMSFAEDKITGSIVFENQYKNLAEFPYNWQWGNIPPMPKRRQGKVHSVKVRRGNVKVVYGKYGFGGFTQQNGVYSMQMFERISSARTPLKLVFGPSIYDSLLWGFKNSSFPTYNSVVRTIPENLLLELKL